MKPPKLVFIVIGFMLASGGGPGRSQATQTVSNPPRSTIRVDSNLVDLPVTVTDQNGRFIDDLSKNNFRVLDNGKQRDIAVFDHGDVPVTVGLVVDHSGSMTMKLAEVRAAAAEFIEASNPQDQLFVVNFNEDVSFTLPVLLPFTSDAEKLRTAIAGSDARGNTALYDAVIDSLDHLKLSGQSRHALIVVTDGGDNASQHTFQQLVTRAMKSKAQIYCIGIYDEGDRDAKPAELKKLAQLTGGEAYFPRTVTEVSQINRKIADTLRKQYTLGILPSTEGGWRSIRVIAIATDSQQLRVQTRSGYIFSENQGAKDQG